MLVVGDHTSANTNRLAELCGGLTKTYLIETAAEIKPEWLKGHHHIGITGGASTSEDTITEVTNPPGNPHKKKADFALNVCRHCR